MFSCMSADQLPFCTGVFVSSAVVINTMEQHNFEKLSLLPVPKVHRLIDLGKRLVGYLMSDYFKAWKEAIPYSDMPSLMNSSDDERAGIPFSFSSSGSSSDDEWTPGRHEVMEINNLRCRHCQLAASLSSCRVHWWCLQCASWRRWM